MTTLNLPDVANPQDTFPLSWDIRLDFDGDITVTLVRKAPSGTSTIATESARGPEGAEDAAGRIWQNYRAVHGYKPQGSVR